MKQNIFKNGSIIIALIALFFFFKIYGFFSDSKSHIIRSDGIGYYAYLPALFIYDDLSYSFLDATLKKYYEGDEVSPNIKDVAGKKVDKYYSGVSILMFPFFTAAHFVTSILHKDADGFSLLYQYAIGIAAIFYLWMGCWFAQKLLMLYRATPAPNFFITFCVVFGTNLSHYAIWEPSISHVYSFACITGFLYHVKKYSIHYSSKNIFYAIVLFSLIFLIRPANVLILICIPFIAGSPENLLTSIKNVFKNRRVLLSSLVIFATFISYQLFIWYKETGHLIVWTYGSERFIFYRPEITNVLFSYSKGLFIWTPLTFISLLGFVYLFTKNRYAFYTLFTFFFILVYVLSCWWAWDYGMSYGFRPMIDYYVLLALLLLFAFELLTSKIFKIVLSVLLLVTIGVNYVQAYQYRNYIILWSDMDKEKYWKVFLKTSDEWKGYLWRQDKYSDHLHKRLSEWITEINQPQKKEINPAQEKDSIANKFPFLKEIGRTQVVLKASNGKYVCAEIDAKGEIKANRSDAKEWETFTLILFENNKCFLKARNNLFVTSDLTYGTKLFANRSEAREWELFTIQNLGNDRWVLKNSRSQFVTFTDSLQDQLAGDLEFKDKDIFVIDTK